MKNIGPCREAMRSSQDIEYLIRMYQRGIKSAVRTNLRLKGEPADSFIELNRAKVLDYAKRITELKRDLFRKTGRCSPQTPPWPL
jgi:hypothetical protein